MIAHLHHRGWHYVLLAGVAAVVFFLNLGAASLWDVDEGRNSTCAMEEMEAGNWIVPTFNGKLRVDKPALLYWLQILSYQTFGINEFAARFPSALAALVTVLLVYELARSMFARTAGLLAGLILATTPMQCGAARFANPDALLNCLTVLTLAVFWFGLAARRWWWFAFLGISSGLAVLAKGPVGLALPGAVAILFLCWQGQWRVLCDRRWLLAAIAFALVALPWYIWVGIETKGEFLTGFLWRHNIERTMTPMENHRGFPGYYLVILLIGTMPWSIVLLPAWWCAAWSALRQPWARFQGWWHAAAETPAAPPDAAQDSVAAYRLLICWIVVYLLLFSIAATKLPNYVLPAVAPCAILMARLLHRWISGALTPPHWLTATGIAGLAVTGVVIAVALPIVAGVGELWFLRGRYFDGLQYWAPLGLVPVASALIGWRFVRKQQRGRFVVALSATAVLLLVPFAAFGSVLFERFKAPRSLVEQLTMLSREDDLRIGCLDMRHLPSLNFYVQRNIEHLDGDNDVPRFLAYRLPVYLFLPARDWQRIEPQLQGKGRVLARHYDMYHHVEIVVVTNR